MPKGRGNWLQSFDYSAAYEALDAPVPWEGNDDLTRWEKVVAFLEFLPITKGILAGTQMKLLPFQIEFVRNLYGDDPEQRAHNMGLQSVPRGQGKTGLLAGLACCHLFGPESEPRGEVYSAAIDRDQAAIVFAEMEAIINEVARFALNVNVQRFHKKLEVIEGPGKGSVFQALSRDARRGHGLAPSFWIYDELAQAKDGELLDNLITGMGKRKESLGCVISTQAPTDQHPLSELIDSPPEGCYVQLICAPEDAPLDDPETYRACNPALGYFLDENELNKQMLRACKQISFEPRFRNLRLNQRVAAEASFVSQPVWKLNGKQPLESAFEAGPVYIGLDLSKRSDLTALIVAAQDGSTWNIRPEFFAPHEGIAERSTRDRVPYDVWANNGILTATDGHSVDYEVVATRLQDICDEYDVAAIAFDPWRMDILEKELSRLGVELPLVPFPQSFRAMAPALDTVEALLDNGSIRHGMHPVLTWCAANSVVDTDNAGNRKLNKARSRGRIDGMVAMVMAIGQAERDEPDGYVESGITFL